MMAAHRAIEPRPPPRMQTKFLPHGTRDAWFAGGSPIALLETWTRSRKPADAVSDLAETPVRPAPSELLRRSLARGRLGHAYLFQGDSIEALETVAIEFVQALFCTQPVAGPDPGVAPAGCGTCPACRRIEHFNHPDVHWVHPESALRQIKVDHMRELMAEMALRPAEAGRKIAIVVGVDRMNANAANAFLKTLEEPPANSLILLLTTEPGRVLETIVSRCQRLSMGSGVPRIEPAVQSWVASVATASGSAPGKALLPRYRVLSEFLAVLGKVHEDIEERIEADSPIHRYPDAEPAQKKQWEKEMAGAVEAEYRRVRAAYLSGLHAWLRDVWATRAGAAVELFLPELKGATAALAARLTEPEARQNLEAWERTQGLLHGNVQESLALEVGLLRLNL